MNDIKTPPAPLYRDPIYDGAADPTVIYNPVDQQWYMLYTQRRANASCSDVSFCGGSQIGLAVAEDGGNYWCYLGALDLNIEWGVHTFWAPEIIYHDGLFHMYVTRIRGVNTRWRGKSYISHYTSKDIFHWEYVANLDLKSDKVIDSCVYQLPNGTFRMWYRNSIDDSYTWVADSPDLYTWTVNGPVIHGLLYHEGQNVFKLAGHYFLIADMGQGMYVFRSDDLEHWVLQEERILGGVSRRIEDGSVGKHADVVCCDEDAYIFYFTHPERTGDFDIAYNELTHLDLPYHLRRSSVQVAKLMVKDGKLSCNRDAPFILDLREE